MYWKCHDNIDNKDVICIAGKRSKRNNDHYNTLVKEVLF